MSTTTVPKLVLTSFSIDGAEPIVAHLVHEAVEEYGRPFLVHTELALRRVVVRLLNVCAALSAAADTHHPQELVYICRNNKVCIDSKARRANYRQTIQ